MEPLDLIETRMRVATWNLWWRFGPWEERQPAIAEALHRLDADVIGLQEVWDIRDGLGQSETLGEKLGYQHVFASGFDAGDAQFGNAILSRWPIVASERRPLPSTPTTQEFRFVLRTEVEGPRGRFDFYTTHLNWRYDESAVRQAQVRALAEFVAESSDRTFPPIVCGDFNADPDSDEIRMLNGRAAVPVPRLVFMDAWDAAGEGPGYTWSNDNAFAARDLEPDRRIDYVFVGWPKERGAGHVVDARVAAIEPIDGVHPSDHYGVVAELRY
ncbi:MAG TPA: endonuclease/exonuclease/phosphatase family protein [Acidimicrobiia bacterium]|nr:endonuclease/exonuclease/phosphatase family protein [Acidimicrobiia bacterium]